MHTGYVFNFKSGTHFMESTLDPKDWGWKLEYASLVPVMTNEEPTSDELLKTIQSNCQVTSKNPCSVNSVLATPMDLIARRCFENGYRGTKCQNGVTSELLVEAQNDIEDRLDSNNFDNIFSL